MKLEQFILGSNRVETESQMRKVTLGAYLILIYLGIDFFFFVVNLFNPEGEPASLFIGSLISLASLLLLRWKWINTAIFLHLLRCNFFAFYFSSIDEDPIQTGSFLYFIPSSLGALAVFGYRERWYGIGFTIVSFVLFIVAIFKPSEFAPDQAHFYLIISFSIVLIISLLIILFFDRMVTNSERALVEKNSELTKLNKELDKFVYSASHDLRAPLSSLAGLIELSRRDPDNRDEYIKLMPGRINAMDKLINDVIDYSRNTRLQPTVEEINFYDLAKEAIDMMKYVDETKKLQAQFIVDESLIIYSDASRLRVILNNLINNSIKYSDSNKDELRIIIRARREGNWFTFSIEDNGVGIAESQQDKIFDMFYRASERATGSGLGLYIVKESLGKLNGSIEYQSSVGIGSKFIITIPVMVA
jgi:signal transduction histidine kinase